MRKVLILEDEVDIRSFVVINLKRAGFQTIEAGSGEEALERLKENPLLSEQDFLPAGSLVALADKVAKFESQLAALKEIENQCKEAKKQLYNEMLKRNVKSWAMPNGTKLTRVDEVPAGTKTVAELDVEAFKAECPATFERYCRMVEKKTAGKAGYVRITVK